VAMNNPWLPVKPGFDLQLLRGGDDDDTRALLLRLQPGTVIELHRHSGEVHAYNIAGTRRILQTDQIVGPGEYVYEPPGNVDSWMAVGTEPLIVFVTVRGPIEYIDERGRVLRSSTTSSLTQAYADHARG
jgi:2,4'-dihydroxyacetophenone dioxygenase